MALPSPRLPLGLLLIAGLLAGCGSSPRFADGRDDPTGPAWSDQSLRGWRPPDADVFVRADNGRLRPLPHAAGRAPRAVAGTVPASWSPPGGERPWRWIVVHHSATHAGGAAEFDRMHRGNGWDELGYHFVVGNGTQTRDGAVEVGPRWLKQKHGAHAKTGDNRFNELGIGVCLVGDFDHNRPSARQLQSLAVLVAYLMDRYDIPPERVIGHGDTKPTACPGRNLYAEMPALRAAAGRAVAAGLLRPTGQGHATIR